MSDANANTPVRKIAHIDLMKIADPDKKARKPLNNGALTFPFFTIENVDIVDGDHIIVGNDNNLPFSSSRDPNNADDNEFVLLKVTDFEGEVRQCHSGARASLARLRSQRKLGCVRVNPESNQIRIASGSPGSSACASRLRRTSRNDRVGRLISTIDARRCTC